MARKPSLRRFLFAEMKARIDQLQEQLRVVNEAAAQIEQFDPKKGEFTVQLFSLWENEGEESTKTKHIGKLSDAISIAEKEFMAKNKRGDVQADYAVTVRIGELDIPVPKEYWQEFMRHH